MVDYDSDNSALSVYLRFIWILVPPQAQGLCFAVINPRVLSANKVDLGFFCFNNFPFLLPPTPLFTLKAPLSRCHLRGLSVQSHPLNLDFRRWEGLLGTLALFLRNLIFKIWNESIWMAFSIQYILLPIILFCQLITHDTLVFSGIWGFWGFNLWLGLHFVSYKKAEFLDKSSKTIDILPDFFEPKWSHICDKYFQPLFIINSFVLPPLLPPHHHLMECGASDEWPGLCLFCCFQPSCVSSDCFFFISFPNSPNRVEFGLFFVSSIFQYHPPPLPLGGDASIGSQCSPVKSQQFSGHAVSPRLP